MIFIMKDDYDSEKQDKQNSYRRKFSREPYFQRIWAAVLPNQTSASPTITFAATFAKAWNMRPSRSRFIVSLPNAAKVVNPPSRPVKINARASAVNTLRVSTSWERKPITKHPMRLTDNVPYGKSILLPRVRVHAPSR